MNFCTITDRLCISRGALVSVMNENTVKAAIQRGDLVPVQAGWYAWDSVPDRWRPALSADLCGGQDAPEWYTHTLVREGLQAMLPAHNPADVVTIMGQKVARERYNIVTGEVWPEDRGTLPEKKRQALLESARWLRLVALLTDAHCRTTWQLSRRQVVEGHLIPLIEKHRIDVPTNYRRLLEKAETLTEQGAKCLISKHWGNNCAAKIADEQMSLLTTLYADPRKPTLDQVWLWYNEMALGNGWKPVDQRTVRRHLRKPEMEYLWTLGRDGLAEWRRKFGYTFWTKHPTMPNLLWVHDGTKVNYWYRTATGRGAKLNCVVVIDAHSYYILGWHIDTKAENANVVRRAVRDAVRHAGGVMPMQYLYDGSSANQSFFSTWPAMASQAEPDRGQSKPIEQMFGKLQQYIMRRNPFFTGQNVTAPAIRSKVNPDAIPHTRDLPPIEQAIEAAELDFEIWNNTPLPALNGLSPKQAYGAKKPDTMAITPDLDRELFWEIHANDKGEPYLKRFESTRMMIAQGREKHHYEVVGPDGLPDMDFYRLHQGEEFIVKLDPESPATGAALYTRDMRYVALAVDRYRAPRAYADRIEGDAEAISDRIAFQKSQVKGVKQRLSEYGEFLTEMDAEEVVKLGHRWIPKELELAAQADLDIRKGRAVVNISDLPETEEIPIEPAPKPKKSLDQLFSTIEEHYND